MGFCGYDGLASVARCGFLVQHVGSEGVRLGRDGEKRVHTMYISVINMQLCVRSCLPLRVSFDANLDIDLIVRFPY